MTIRLWGPLLVAPGRMQAEFLLKKYHVNTRRETKRRECDVVNVCLVLIRGGVFGSEIQSLKLLGCCSKRFL